MKNTTWIHHSPYGNETLHIEADEYRDGTLYLAAVTEDGEYYADITVCLDHPWTSSEYAFVDINNAPWAEEMIRDLAIGEPTGMTEKRGFCTYPLYRFNI